MSFSERVVNVADDMGVWRETARGRIGALVVGGEGGRWGGWQVGRAGMTPPEEGRTHTRKPSTVGFPEEKSFDL